MPTREETTALAERLARRERFNPAWITYPDWAGSAPDIAPILQKAKKYKEWAHAILTKTLPPPPWLAEESPEFQDPALNTRPPKNPNNLKEAAACIHRQTRPIVTAWLILFRFQKAAKARKAAQPPPPTSTSPPAAPDGNMENTRQSLPRPRRCPTETRLFDNRIAVRAHRACC